MAILITGGAGYIGSHTCVELLNAGYDIVVIDNFSNSKPEALRRVRQLTGKDFSIYPIDLLELDLLERVFYDHSIEAVIHFAGLKSVGESVEQPLLYYHNNLCGTIALCRVMAKHDVHRFIFSSSATVYGLPERLPIPEDHPLSATNPYGRTKLMIEHILSDLSAANPSWSVAILRYFNPIGAHKSGLIGEDPEGIPANLMPYITRVAAGTLDRLSIFGNDYNTPDGTGVRDYIHVVDLAIGHVKALNKVFSSSGVSAYNLGTGRGYSVLDIVNTVERVTGKPIPTSISPRRPGDVGSCFADPSKAKQELGWVAERDLEEMCEDAWRWQAENMYGYEEIKASGALR